MDGVVKFVLLWCSFRGYDVVITTYHLVGTEASTVLEDQAEEENKVCSFPQRRCGEVWSSKVEGRCVLPQL